MRDLKHLLFFEELLMDSNNDLIEQAREAGQVCIGNLCYQMPEILLNLPGCFAVRLRAPRTTSMEMGSYYMTSLNCEYVRALLERAIEGGYNFLDGIIEPYACSQMTSCAENIENLHVVSSRNPNFFVEHVDTPMKADENGVRHMVRMCKARVLPRLEKDFGIDVSDEALRTATARYNEICSLIQQIGAFRKLDNPTITGYEFSVLCLATYCCPWDLIKDKLQETLEELQQRQPDPKPDFRVRVLLGGSEVDDPDFIRLIEECGARVVADRYCFGSFPGRVPLELNDSEDILTQICRHTVMNCQCPRYMDNERIQQRKEYLHTLAREYKADGIILQQVSFCNFWPYERAGASRILSEEYGWPVLSVERPYIVGSSGQMRTRIQAFVENIEFKKLKGGAPV